LCIKWLNMHCLCIEKEKWRHWPQKYKKVPTYILQRENGGCWKYLGTFFKKRIHSKTLVHLYLTLHRKPPLIRFWNVKFFAKVFFSREKNLAIFSNSRFAYASRISVVGLSFEYCRGARVARWYIFKPKIPIWVNFGGPWNGKGWYIQWTFGVWCNHLVYLMSIS
jgi:hypothetical protein